MTRYPYGSVDPEARTRQMMGLTDLVDEPDDDDEDPHANATRPVKALVDDDATLQIPACIDDDGTAPTLQLDALPDPNTSAEIDTSRIFVGTSGEGYMPDAKRSKKDRKRRD